MAGLKLFPSMPVRRVVEVAIIQLFSYAFPLLALPILSRMLGIAEFGTLFWHLSAVGMVGVLSNFAFDFSGTRALVQQPTDAERIEHLKHILWAKLALATLGILGLLALGLSGWVVLDPLLSALLALEVLVGSIVPTLYFLATAQTSRSVLFQLIGRSVLFLGVLTAFIFGLPITAWHYAALMVLSQLSVLVLSLSLIPNLTNDLFPDWKQSVRAVRDGLPMFATFSLTHVYTTGNVLFVALLAGDAEAGRFSAAAKLMGVATQLLVGSASLVMFPGAVHAAQRQDQRSVVWPHFRFVLGGGILLALGFGLLGSHLVGWFFGSEYRISTSAAAALGCLGILVGVSNTFGTQGLVASGREGTVGGILALGAGVAAIGHIVLIPHFGAEGGIYAWILAEAFVAFSAVIAYRRFQRRVE
jgi:PST family polysaccharide transporter